MVMIPTEEVTEVSKEKKKDSNEDDDEKSGSRVVLRISLWAAPLISSFYRWFFLRGRLLGWLR